MLNDSVVLITGGTGSFGQACAKYIGENYKPKKLIIFSRDELKQFEMAQRFSPQQYPFIRFFLGDVRDQQRLFRAFKGVDYVIHAAALKQVPAAEYNPFEAIKTNIMGAQNIINAAVDHGVKKVVALSTDKAANPVNLYGATKLCSDKLFIQGNTYVGQEETCFAVVRYGNVVGSRGSVIPFFMKKLETGVIPITHPEMTRFWVTIEQAVKFVLDRLTDCCGGELFVPKLPSMRIVDLAKAIAPNCEQEVVGIRPGEKIHEIMITRDDARHTREFKEMYVVEPEFRYWGSRNCWQDGGTLPDGFEYSSGNNQRWLENQELVEMIRQLGYAI